MSTKTKNLRPEKQAMYAEVQESISDSQYMLLTDCTGMSMPETLELKKRLSSADAKTKVVKNRMLNLICDDLDTLTGQTTMICGSTDVVEAAKILSRFFKETQKPTLKGGLLDGSVLSADDVTALAKLPGKKELQAVLVATLAAPMTQVVGVMNQKVCSLLYVLNAVSEKKEQAA